MLFTLSSPSCSSQSEDDCPEMTATQLLSLAIKKRRALYNSKERDFRKELLHTTIIQSLCKHLGEGRARRRRHRGKRRSVESKGAIVGDDSTLSGGQNTCDETQVQTPLDAEPAPKRVCLAVTADEEDPFGLDDLFVRHYGKPARDMRGSGTGCSLQTGGTG